MQTKDIVVGGEYAVATGLAEWEQELDRLRHVRVDVVNVPESGPRNRWDRSSRPTNLVRVTELNADGTVRRTTRTDRKTVETTTDSYPPVTITEDVEETVEVDVSYTVRPQQVKSTWVDHLESVTRVNEYRQREKDAIDERNAEWRQRVDNLWVHGFQVSWSDVTFSAGLRTDRARAKGLTLGADDVDRIIALLAKEEGGK